jgi:hypothetical protein
MKKLLLITGIIIMNLSVFSQKTVVVVEPDGWESGAINNAVDAAAEAGTLSNTIFELRSGGMYYLTTDIKPKADLHIRLEAGATKRAVLQPTPNEDGASEPHFLAQGGNVTLEGLHLHGIAELTGFVPGHPIKIEADGTRVVFDSCYVEYAEDRVIRLQSSNNTVIFKNSVFRNIGMKSSLYNGRLIDTRGNPQDSIIVENCTIYNVMAYLFEGVSQNTLNYMKVNHNTVYGAGFLQYGIRVGDAKEAYVTNNVFYNMALQRRTDSHTPFFRADTVGSNPILPYTDADRTIVFKNNNWFNDPQYAEIITSLDPDTTVTYAWDDEAEENPIKVNYIPGDVLFADQKLLDLAEAGTVLDASPTILSLIELGVVDTVNNFREELVFENPTPFKQEFYTAVMETGRQLSSLVIQPEVWDDEDLNLVPEVESGRFSFHYNAEGTRSGTAASDGGAIGMRGEPINYVDTIPTTVPDTVKIFGFFTENEDHKTGGDFFADFADKATVEGSDLEASTFDMASTEQVFEGEKALKIDWDGVSDDARVQIGVMDEGDVDIFKVSYGKLKFQVYLTDTIDFRLVFYTNKNNEGNGDVESALDDDLGVMDANKIGEWQEVEIDLSQEFDGDMLTFEEFRFIGFRNKEEVQTTMYIDDVHVELADADVLAPEMSRGYPSTAEVKPHRAVLAVWPNEASYVYTIIKSSTETPPTKEEILATNAIFYGENMEEAIQFETIGLEADTEQTVYVVLKDRMNNTTEIITYNFSTIPNVTADYGVTKTSTPIAITNEVDARWEGVDAISLDSVVYGPGDIQDENDLSASAKFLWDDNNLYALLEVNDANIYGAPEGDPISGVYGMYTETEEHKTGGYLWDDSEITGVQAWKEEGGLHDSKADGTVASDSSYIELDNVEITPYEGATCIKLYQHGNKNGRLGIKCDRTGSLRKLNNSKLVFYVYLEKSMELYFGLASTKSNGFDDGYDELAQYGMDKEKLNEWQRIEMDLSLSDYDDGKILFNEFESIFFSTRKWADADDWGHRGTFYVDDIHFEYSLPMNVDNIGFYLDVNDSKYEASGTALKLPNNESVEIISDFGNDTTIAGDNLTEEYTPEMAFFTNDEKTKYYVQAAFNWESLGFDYQPTIAHGKRMGFDIRVEDNDLGNIAESMISIANVLGKYDCSNWGNMELMGYPVSAEELNFDDSDKLNIYPNPTSSFLNIGNEFERLQIMDMNGQLIYQSEDNSMKILNVSNFKSGIYIISIINDNQRLIGRFVKK